MSWRTSDEAGGVLIGEGPMLLDERGVGIGIVVRQHAELAASAPDLLEVLEEIVGARSRVKAVAALAKGARVIREVQGRVYGALLPEDPLSPEGERARVLDLGAGTEFGEAQTLVLDPVTRSKLERDENLRRARDAGLDPEDPLGEGFERAMVTNDVEQLLRAEVVPPKGGPEVKGGG